MRKFMKSVMLLPVVAALSLAGPPSGGHSSGGHAVSGRTSGFGVRSGPPAVSGPTPIGASGSTPLNAVGSLRPVYGLNGSRGYGRGTGRYPYGYYPGAFVMPFYGYGGYGDDYYDGGSGPMADYGPDPQAAAMNEDALGQQLQQLSAQIQDLRYQQQQGMGPGGPPVAAPRPADSDPQDEVPITLVLHSGQQLQVKNYAVTEGMFWDFSKRPAQKIPVSSIDIPASEKATEANGGDFPPITQ